MSPLALSPGASGMRQRHRTFACRLVNEQEKTMILGVSIASFTAFHVVLSLVGIVAGLVALAGMLKARRLPGWTAVFLATTVLTSVTGYFFPRDTLLPSHIVGALSLVILAIAIAALYGAKLAGRSRAIYAATATASLYLNVFVLVAQAFQKVPALNALAPTPAAPAFGVAQGIVLVAFVVLGWKAVRQFHPADAQDPRAGLTTPSMR